MNIGKKKGKLEPKGSPFTIEEDYTDGICLLTIVEGDRAS